MLDGSLKTGLTLDKIIRTINSLGRKRRTEQTVSIKLFAQSANPLLTILEFKNLQIYDRQNSFSSY